jgi:hypothetical protein
MSERRKPSPYSYFPCVASASLWLLFSANSGQAQEWREKSSWAEICELGSAGERLRPSSWVPFSRRLEVLSEGKWGDTPQRLVIIRQRQLGISHTNNSG